MRSIRNDRSTILIQSASNYPDKLSGPFLLVDGAGLRVTLINSADRSYRFGGVGLRVTLIKGGREGQKEGQGLYSP